LTAEQHHQAVATVTGTPKTDDTQVTQDEIVTETTSANTKTLKGIDFSRNKESLVLGQIGM
jgi:hypothetical protein